MRDPLTWARDSLRARLTKKPGTPFRRLHADAGGPLHPSRASRHSALDIVALRKRRAKNRVARRSRAINRQGSK